MFVGTTSAVRFTDCNCFARHPNDESLGYFQPSARLTFSSPTVRIPGLFPAIDAELDLPPTNSKLVLHDSGKVVTNSKFVAAN